MAADCCLGSNHYDLSIFRGFGCGLGAWFHNSNNGHMSAGNDAV